MMTLQHLQVGYGRYAVAPPISGAFHTGSLTAIIGANGSGKSTLLKTLAGFLPPVAGAVIRHVRQPLAYLPQQAELDRQFPLLVEDLVAMGRVSQRGLFARLQRSDRQWICEALERVGMLAFARQPVGILSGGQFQRVLFARLLVQQAPVMLLDEPFTGVDTPTIQLLLEMIAEWHQQQRTVIAVLHDRQMVSACFPQTLLLSANGNHWGATPHVMRALNAASATTSAAVAL